ncbi:MAG: F0F1 ATP synthase subunit epsilon [Gammaproteobacteria bacterium]
MDIQVDIVSAEQEIWSGYARMVFAPGEMGELGILPRHSPLLSRLKAGEVRIVGVDESEHSFFISGGILEIQPHVVTILADTAIRAGDLDEAAAIEAKRRAEDVMAERKSEMDFARAKAELSELSALIETIKKIRNRKA